MGDFKVNDHVTIKEFKLSNVFEMKLKFGDYYKYQKFSGKLDDVKVEGWQCVLDLQIYGMKKIPELIQLKSIGCGIDSEMYMYGQLIDDSYDLDCGMPIQEWIKVESVFDKISKKDLITILKEMVK